MKYSLTGINGNAFAILGYVSRALKNEGLVDKVDEMLEKATSEDYYNLIVVCMDYLELANKAAEYKDYK